ncbi:MAG: type I restriction enzyme HsdR N-terminal domain-containing protein, partial [Candidatus Hodarchaeota archaeon]
ARRNAMRETLKDIRKKLANKMYANEEHVRLSLVARILKDLGWDIWNPNEVHSEFAVVPTETQSRVDLALFLHPPVPSVFLEVKAVGKLEGNIREIERQLRDYNLNNTAMFSVITDGRQWRFYYSQTGGEFYQKHFKTLDIIEGDIDKLESSFRTFLSKREISKGNAKREAENQLQLSQKQRAIENALPKARRLIVEPPFPSFPEALVNTVNEYGFPITVEEASNIIRGTRIPEPVTEREREKAEPYFRRITPSKWKKIRNNIIYRRELWKVFVEKRQMTSTEIKALSDFKPRTLGPFTRYVTHSKIASKSEDVFRLNEAVIPEIQKLLVEEPSEAFVPEFRDPKALKYLRATDAHRRRKIKENILNRRELWEAFMRNKRMTTSEFKRLSHFKPKGIAGFMRFLEGSGLSCMFGDIFILNEDVIPEIGRLIKESHY